ncbi:hypothetical protein BDV09DRAFT_181359 [Aspergillus tetrazonus]
MSQQIKDIRPLNRLVTTHNSDGKAVFSPRLIESMPAQTVNGFTFSLAYTSTKFPCELSNESNIASYENHLLSPPGLTISSGTVCRIVDFPPAAESPMHRTISLRIWRRFRGKDRADTGLWRKPGDEAWRCCSATSNYSCMEKYHP